MKFVVELCDIDLEEYGQDKDESRLDIVPDFHRFLPRGEFYNVDLVAEIKVKNIFL